VEPSHVLLALGQDEDTTHYAIRIGLGRLNTMNEVKFTVEKISSIVKSLKQIHG
jgi:cysteine desulfurase